MKTPKRSRLLVVASVLVGISVAVGVAFFAYEDLTYGTVARSYPSADLDSLIGCALPELDAKCSEYGYKKLDNPFFGRFPLSIPASDGTWLVTLLFDDNDKVTDYKVLYSNVDSALYHNRVLR